uniref:Farnesoic acid O-methyltransferase n=1 Tax=Bombyx mori TaxID=7091 RepID=S5RN30_BOMMO|nr:farnesoic acid O-methyltransferase [Bombyx mori]
MPGTYRWVPACLSQRSIPPGALRVGTDADGDEIYAGRAHHEGDIVPAKVIPTKNACYISFGGEEVLKDQFEVLVPSMFAWQFSTNGEVPPGAVEAGSTADGEKLYFGRVNHDGCTTPGKIHPSHACCYYPFDGEERSSAEYECLVLM